MFPKSKKWIGFRETGIAVKRAALPLLTPVIIMGGMMSGFFTPTEAASIAALYTFILGYFVYREIKLKKLVQSCFSTVRITSNIMLIVGFAGVFGWILISEQVAMVLTEWVDARLKEFERGLRSVARRQAARFSGIAAVGTLDRWDDESGWS